MKQKITNIIGMLEMGAKTDEQAIAELLDLFSVSNRRELLLAFIKFCKNENGLHIPLSYINEFLNANNCG